MPVDHVVAGLGNPGERYRGTRHNLGFQVVEALARSRGGRWRDDRRGWRAARITLAGRDILLVQPMTFMNLSGDAVGPIVEAEALPLPRLLVVCDDIALPLGQLRLRPSGSDGGHNGLGSIIDVLDAVAFPRLRLGVGPVPDLVDAAEFVLAEFLPEEEGAVNELVDRAVECVASWVTVGVDRTMGRFNARPRPAGDDAA